MAFLVLSSLGRRAWKLLHLLRFVEVERPDVAVPVELLQFLLREAEVEGLLHCRSPSLRGADVRTGWR